MTTYTIEEVNERNEYDGAYGPMTGYTLTLVGVPEQVGLNQKRETPPPTVGQDLELELSSYSEDEIRRYPPNATRLKAKKVQAQGGMFGPRPEDPARSRAIQRMWSLGHSIELVKFGVEAGRLEMPEDYRGLWELVTREADRLDKDVQRVRDAAS